MTVAGAQQYIEFTQNSEGGKNIYWRQKREEKLRGEWQEGYWKNPSLQQRWAEKHPIIKSRTCSRTLLSSSETAAAIFPP